jgi:hypothetical protein
MGEVQLIGGAAEMLGAGRHLKTAQRGQEPAARAFL